jgi:hypothetical protein
MHKKQMQGNVPREGHAGVMQMLLEQGGAATVDVATSRLWVMVGATPLYFDFCQRCFDEYRECGRRADARSSKSADVDMAMVSGSTALLRVPALDGIGAVVVQVLLVAEATV